MLCVGEQTALSPSLLFPDSFLTQGSPAMVSMCIHTYKANIETSPIILINLIYLVLAQHILRKKFAPLVQSCIMLISWKPGSQYEPTVGIYLDNSFSINYLGGLPSNHHISMKNVWQNCHTTISLWPPTNSGAKSPHHTQDSESAKNTCTLFWG